MSDAGPHAGISISLEGGEPSGETVWFRPGTLISGRVEIMPKQNLDCKGILIELKWFTRGRGEMDEEIVSEKVVQRNVLTAGESLHESFSFLLPSKPWSFNGRYLNLVWVVHVKLLLPFKTDAEANLPFVMAPEAEPVHIESG